jgi:hypothetical protein
MTVNAIIYCLFYLFSILLRHGSKPQDYGLETIEFNTDVK